MFVPMRGEVGFLEDLRPTLDAAGLGGRDAYERARRSCAERGPVAESPLPLQYPLGSGKDPSRKPLPPGFPLLLRAWAADGFPRGRGRSYTAFFRELEAWTERWMVERPETVGRFGRGAPDGGGAFEVLAPRDGDSRLGRRWAELATSARTQQAAAQAAFDAELSRAPVKEAVLTLDLLASHLFRRHYGQLSPCEAGPLFLDAVQRYAADILPGDACARPTMSQPHGWFLWGMVIEGARRLSPRDGREPIRRHWMAAMVAGAATDAAVRRRFRTRALYATGPDVLATVHRRGMALCASFEEAAAELRALHVIREHGEGPGHS